MTAIVFALASTAASLKNDCKFLYSEPEYMQMSPVPIVPPRIHPGVPAIWKEVSETVVFAGFDSIDWHSPEASPNPPKLFAIVVKLG